ncbi:MAG TPA: hypothetical protein VNO43_11600 [Candidatus Eisenbacteria bacterium]|nr:hypothetical protein [Candidatus Eisenbacteria bacterium]
MSKLLLVEPSKILQQAMIRALVPQHEVKVVEAMPESVIETGCDAIIIDASALRDRGALDANAARAIQSLPVPIVWLEAKDETDVPRREKLAVVTHPITKDALSVTLAQCLPPAARSNGKEINESAADAGKEETAPTGEAAPVVELVDVVEEAPPKDQSTR